MAGASSAIVAVKPWTKLRSPTGPISPAQKNPAAGAPVAPVEYLCVVIRSGEHVRAPAVACEQ